MTFTISPVGVPGRAASKTAVAATGNAHVSCSDLATTPIPPQSEICAGPEILWTSVPGFPGNEDTACGSPVGDTSTRGACAWTSGITLHGTTVSAGTLACAGGGCSWSGSRSRKSTLFGTPVATDEGYTCAWNPKVGWTGAYILIGGVRLVDSSGQTCQWTSLKGIGAGSGLRSTQLGDFTIPAAWSGTLDVEFRLQSWFSPANAPSTATLEEDATAAFHLKGTGGGCSRFAP